MHVERHAVTLTTDAGGAATGYTPPATGRVLSITYAKTDFANGVDVTVTAEATGQAVWTGTDVNASTTVYPRAQVSGTTGAALVFGTGFPVAEPVAVANDRVKIVVGSGGDTKTGTFHVVIG